MPSGSTPTCDCGACTKCKRRDYQREYMRAYRAEGRPSEVVLERARERARQWTADNPERARAQSRLYKQRNPEKAAARMALNSAIRRGEVARMPCDVCGDPKAEGHHHDYSRPLEVRWLCRAHHVEAHAQEAA